MSQILLMSNDPVLRKKNVEVLVESGMQITDVTEGLDGLLMVDKNGFQVIIIDEELSDIDGYRACQKMRQYSDIPIILLGSEKSEDIWSKVEELGFDIYMKKPVSPRELVARVLSLLSRTGTEQKTELYIDQKKADGLTPSETLHPKVVPFQCNERVVEDQPLKVKYPVQQPTARIKPIASVEPSISPELSRAGNNSPGIGTSGKQVAPNMSQVQRKESGQFKETAEGVPLQGIQHKKLHDVPVSPVQSKTTESRHGRQRIGMQQEPTIASIQHRVTERQTLQPTPFEAGNSSIAPFQETGVVHLEAIPCPSGTSQSGGATKYEIWNDGRVAKLLGALITGKLVEIAPVINISVKGGFAFPDADGIMETTGEQTRDILDALGMELILERRQFERISVDPDGSYQLVPVERCPRCNSGNISKGQLIEHFFCGNVGLDQDYKSKHKYKCPKCNRELMLLGTDYRNAGLQYRCIECSEIFPSPIMKWRNLQTGKLWMPEDLTTIQLYSYRLVENRREWLEFQLKPKLQLLKLLKIRGFHIEEAAQFHGRSGAIHTIDVLATKDDGLSKLFLGVGILTSKPGEIEVGLEDLFKFDIKAYDMRLNYKVVFVIPRLSPEAMKFAEIQKIGVFEARDPDTMMTFLESKSRLAVPVLTREKARYLLEELKRAGPHTNPYHKLKALLKGNGYSIVENAKVIGKSGAEHVFAIFAQRDDILVKPAMAIEIAHAENGQAVDIDKVCQFDAKTFDAGIRNKIFIAVPQLTSQAKLFAHQQRIKVLKELELDGLLSSMYSI